MPAPQCFYGAEPIFFGGSFRTAPFLPKSMSEGGDVLLLGCVGDYAWAMLVPVSRVLVLCVQVGPIGVLQRLSGTLMSGRVIFFSVVLGTGAVGVCGATLPLNGDSIRFAHSRCQCTYRTVCRTGQAKGVRGFTVWPDRQIPHGVCRLCTSRR